MAKRSNILTEVTGQAATGRKVIGTIIENKILDNKKFEITEFSAEGKTFTAQEIIPEGEEPERVPTVVTITEKNAEAFRYVVNPNKKPAPEAELIEDNNGRKFLVIGGNKISCGTLPVTRVIGGVTGEVILATEANDGAMNLLRYIVQTDKFEPIGNIVGENIEMVKLGDVTLLVDNIIEKVPQTDKDGNPVVDNDGEQLVKDRCVSAKVYTYRNGYLNIELGRDADSYCEYCEYDEDEDDDDDIAIVPIESIRLIEQGKRRDYAVVTTLDTDGDGYLTEGTARVTLYQAYDDGTFGGRCGRYELNDKDAKIYLGGSFRKAPVVTITDKDRIIIRDAYGTKVVDDPEVVAEMAGYVYFCGTEMDGDDVVFTYADKDYNIKSFRMERTDRGILFSVC